MANKDDYLKIMLEPSDKQVLTAVSKARASNDGGTVSPSAFAVLRLMTSSYLVGACTGMLAGFSPLRMRSTQDADRRYRSRIGTV
jgi:hypothetical protein